MALIVSTPEKLTYVRLLIPKDLVSKAITTLQRMEAIHVEKVGKLSEEDRRALAEAFDKLKRFSNLIEVLESQYKKAVLVEVKRDLSYTKLEENFNKLMESLSQALNKVEALISNQKKVSEELEDLNKKIFVLESISKNMKNLKVADLSFKGEALFSSVILGRNIKPDVLISSLPKDVVILFSEVIDEDIILLVAGHRYLYKEFEECVKKVKAEILEFPSIDASVTDFLSELRKRMKDLSNSLKRMEEELNNVLRDIIDDLALAKVLKNVFEERLTALSNALSGEYLFAIEGWVPSRNIEALKNALELDVKYYLITAVHTDKIPPTKMNNPKFMKPFELITKFYGVPSPDEWDPTPIITYSLTIFFGLMFADVVYGIILFLLVKYFLDRSGFIDNPKSPSYLALKNILKTLAISSTFFGLLSNTYAGYSIKVGPEGLVFTTGGQVFSIINLADPLAFLSMSLVIGLIHINLAHVLSLLVGLKRRDLGRVLNEAGLIISEVFGIPYVLHQFLKYDLIALPNEAYTYLLYASLAGILIMVLGMVKLMGGFGLFLWIFNITGVLGDVLSYSRIAGLGLATYVMALNFNQIALGIYTYFNCLIPVVGTALGVVLMLMVALVMNAFNVVFGTLGSFVHSMRLCFVEFLPKWYDGNGFEFKPLTLNVSTHVLVGKSLKIFKS